jgi:predicted MFS family arabinose efflux permease
VAVGEAGSTPAAHAFIARSFPPACRAAPLAVLTLSAPVATMLALIGGGLVAAALGWRNTFLVMGGLSLVIAPLVLVILGGGRGPAREPSARAADRSAYMGLLRKRSFAVILVASSFIGIGSYALTAFGPAFLMRVHGLSVAEVGVRFGVASGVAGVMALLLIGALADRLSTRDPRWHLWTVAAMAGLFTPCTVAALLVADGRAALTLLALGNAFGAAYFAPLVAAIQRLAPTHLRASASAIMLFCTAVLGGLGPLIAGMISDALQPQLGAAALARGLLVAPIAWTTGGLLYLAATRRFRAEMVEE